MSNVMHTCHECDKTWPGGKSACPECGNTNIEIDCDEPYDTDWPMDRDCDD